MKIIKKILGLITFGAILVSYGLYRDFFPEPVDLYNLYESYLTSKAKLSENSPYVLYEKIKGDANIKEEMVESSRQYDLLDNGILSLINMTLKDAKELHDSVGVIKAMDIICERLDQYQFENKVNNQNIPERDSPERNSPERNSPESNSSVRNSQESDSPVPIENKGAGANGTILWVGFGFMIVAVSNVIYYLVTN